MTRMIMMRFCYLRGIRLKKLLGRELELYVDAVSAAHRIVKGVSHILPSLKSAHDMRTFYMTLDDDISKALPEGSKIVFDEYVRAALTFRIWPARRISLPGISSACG